MNLTAVCISFEQTNDMDANEMIQQALGGAGKMVGGDQLFILEGQVERNELRVLTADEVFKNNVAAFRYGIVSGYVFLGMYTTREAAEESIETIRRLIRDEDGLRPE